MQDRFKFRAVLKTSEFTILVKPYYILEDSYFIDINQAETEFKKKYPEECFWDLIDEIKKQDYVQEISSDSDLIITKDFTNLIQCTGLKDKNGKLIYEGDILKHPQLPHKVVCEWFNDGFWLNGFMNGAKRELKMLHSCYEVIGNIYENAELLEE